MTDQFHFSLGSKVSYSLDDYFVSSCNEVAFKHVTSFPNWGEGRLAKVCLIYGPKFSGKTHIANIFSSVSGAKFIHSNDLEHFSPLNIVNSNNAFIIDDFDQKLEYEEAMFHIFNECLDRGKFLLFLSSSARNHLKFMTKDFASRIMAINDIEIKDPSLELMEAIIHKNFSDRQILISPEITKYILTRINRSYRAIEALTRKIDQVSLAQKSRINLSLVKEVLQGLEEYR